MRTLAQTLMSFFFFCLHNNYSNFILKLKLKVLDSPWSPEVILRPHLPAILCIAPWKCVLIYPTTFWSRWQENPETGVSNWWLSPPLRESKVNLGSYFSLTKIHLLAGMCFFIIQWGKNEGNRINKRNHLKSCKTKYKCHSTVQK